MNALASLVLLATLIFPDLPRKVPEGRTVVLFNPASPDVGPYPTDQLTIPDSTQLTGLRVNIPQTDCARRGACDDLGIVNQYDGFPLSPRQRVRFSAPVDEATLRDGLLFVAEDLSVIPVTEVLYDRATNTVYARPEEGLAEGKRYGIAVTSAIRDAMGDPVAADPRFLSCLHRLDNGYCEQLADFVRRVRGQLGSRRVVSASLFTTMSASAWLRSARTALQSSEVAVRVAENGVVSLSETASLVARIQVAERPRVLQDLAIPLPALQGVGRIAFGSFTSPHFLNDTLSVTSVSTGSQVALPSARREISFMAFLPAAAAPPNGFPVAVFLHGLAQNRFIPSALVAGTFARHGVAVIAIDSAGQGGGPDGRVVITRSNRERVELISAGRAIDLDGDGGFATAGVPGMEGCLLVGGPGLIDVRGCTLQTVLDSMQLVRTIRRGIDLDDDARADFDGSQISIVGFSQGAVLGTTLAAMEPDISKAALNAAGGPVIEIFRRSTLYRPFLGLALALHSPGLLNAPPPAFVDRPRSRDAMVEVIDGGGIADIEGAIELSDWVQATANPVNYAPLLRSRPESILFQIAQGDPEVVNFTSASVIRAARMRERTSVLNYDAARAAVPELALVDGMVLGGPTRHHFLWNLATPPSAVLALATQEQIARFLVGDTGEIPDVNPLVEPVFGRALFAVPEQLPE